MANSVFQIKRTSVSGRAANSTTLPNPGELAINMADQIMYSTNGTTIFEIGANSTNLRVTGNATIKAIVANGSLGTADQVLTTNGTVIYWKTPAAGGGGSVNVDAQYSWTNLHFFSNAVNFASQTANSTGIYPFANSSGSALGHGGARWYLFASNGYFTGNVGIGTSVQTDTKLQLLTAFNNDFTSWGIYNYVGDNNVAITAARNRYGLQNQIYNFSQNKSADGLTTYLSNYRAFQSDAHNGSTSTGGDAFAEEMTAGRFSAYQYANGVNANGVTTLSGTRNYAFQYGSGVISNAYGSLNTVYVGNNSVTGNISFAVGVYSSITSNTASTIAGGYLFYGDHQGTTTTNKYGIYLNNEANNWMSGSLYTGGNVFIGAQTVFATSSHANSTGVYPQANTVGKELGSTTRRWSVFASNGDFRGGNVGIGTAVATDTKLNVGITWSSDPGNDLWNTYIGTTDSNASMTAARTKYGIHSSMTSTNQNKNADGITKYLASYRALSVDFNNGLNASGGDATADYAVGTSSRVYQYANGASANLINNAIAVRGQVFQYGSGVINTAYAALNEISVNSNSVSGNIGTAYGTYSIITSNLAMTINNGYLFYGQHFGTTTTNKYGVYVVGETSNFFSGNVGIGTGTSNPSYKLHVNGSFAATTKSFVIDHPTKPDKFLRYGSLEGPENGVYVRGKLFYDKKIYLPEYWQELVDADSITVNITPTQPEQEGAFVMHTNSTVIELNQSYCGFYTVFAERKDVPKLDVEFDK